MKLHICIFSCINKIKRENNGAFKLQINISNQFKYSIVLLYFMHNHCKNSIYARDLSFDILFIHILRVQVTCSRCHKYCHVIIELSLEFILDSTILLCITPRDR